MRAAVISGDMGDDERARVMASFGKTNLLDEDAIDLLINDRLLAEGYDESLIRYPPALLCTARQDVHAPCSCMTHEGFIAMNPWVYVAATYMAQTWLRQPCMTALQSQL